MGSPCRPLGALGSTRARPMAPRLHPARGPGHMRVTCALVDPWATLGVPKSASEKEVKKAHRRLVLETHPDVRGGDDPATRMRFMRVQEAYELIMGKRAGKDIDNRPADKSGWQFHDWYWKFSMKRRKGQGPLGAATGADGEPPPELLRQQWQAQMAGLKHKAASKRTRRPTAAAGAAAAAGRGATAAAAREDVWRSMTTNARASNRAAAQQAAEAEPLASVRSVAPQAVAASAPQPQPQAAPAGGRPAAAEPRHAGAGAPEPAHAHHQAARHHVAPHQTHAAADQAGGAASHIERLRKLLEHAATLVAPRRAPAPPAAAGRRARSFMSLDQLTALLSGRHGAAAAAPEGASSAIPADAHLRQRLEASMRHHRQQRVGEATAGHPAAGCEEDEVAELRRREARRHTAHSRKFAQRDEVEGRLSTQLAGLKRRAALKQEVESSC